MLSTMVDRAGSLADFLTAVPSSETTVQHSVVADASRVFLEEVDLESPVDCCRLNCF